MNKSEMIALAKVKAAEHGLDPALLCAVCEHESVGWNQYAIRYEPAFFARYIHPAHPDKPSTDDMLSAMSFGLGQIMGEVAQELGFVPKFPNWHAALFEPEVNLEYTCRKLKQCMDKSGGDERAALLRYNGGANSSYPGLVLPRKANYQSASAASAG